MSTLNPDSITREELERLRAFLRAQPELTTEADGARLHAEKNAPWVNGMYSHLKFPPYVYQPYPKMLYAAAYGEAVKARAQAYLLPARGTDDSERSRRILEAERALEQCMCIVQTPEEHRRRKDAWYDSPDEAELGREQQAQAVAQAAAERAFDDRRLGEKAKVELKDAEESAEGHVLDVKPRSHKKKELTDA